MAKKIQKKQVKKVVKKVAKKQASTASKRTTAAGPITPLHDRVIIRHLSESEMGTKSLSGIIIPESLGGIYLNSSPLNQATPADRLTFINAKNAVAAAEDNNNQVIGEGL